jgi:hypothetical protein
MFSKAVTILLAAVMIVGLFWIIPNGGTIDFTVFYHAGQALATGRPWDAYQSGSGFFNPPWIMVPMAAFTILPIRAAYGVFTLLGCAGYMTAFRRMGADWLDTMLLMASPWTFYGLLVGNIDWIVLLGCTLTPEAGVWLALLKPQLSALVYTDWLFRGIDQSWWRYFSISGPVCIALAASWALHLWQPVGRLPWSWDIFPWGVPIGLLFGYLGLRRHDGRLALAAMPLISTYVAMHSWGVVLLPVIGRRWLLLAGLVTSWVIVILWIGR